MKKLIAFVTVLFIGISVMAPSAEAVVAPNGMANQCCNMAGYAVCWVPWMPAGANCYCNGVPGVGYAC